MKDESQYSVLTKKAKSLLVKNFEANRVFDSVAYYEVSLDFLDDDIDYEVPRLKQLRKLLITLKMLGIIIACSDFSEHLYDLCNEAKR